ncbi:unnamed protein product, partial [Urochloa humidicola]
PAPVHSCKYASGDGSSITKVILHPESSTGGRFKDFSQWGLPCVSRAHKHMHTNDLEELAPGQLQPMDMTSAVDSSASELMVETVPICGGECRMGVYKNHLSFLCDIGFAFFLSKYVLR